MNAQARTKLVFAVVLLLAAVLTIKNTEGLGGTEFSGGRITGPILMMSDVAVVGFAAAILIILRSIRFASFLGLTASFLCTPMLLYVITPGPFRAVFHGEYSMPLQSGFYWNRWWISAAMVVATVAALSIRNLFRFRRIEQVTS